MINPSNIEETFFLKQGDIGVFNVQVNAQIRDGWVVVPESYNYDHGLFTIMFVKLKKETK